MSMNDTPRSNRLHIGVFGKCNAGKSTLVNALTNQQISLVSDVPGTTTDPVLKSMEINGIGACVFIDTAGFDDIGELGEKRVAQTEKVLDKTDIAVVVFSENISENEIHWISVFLDKKIPLIPVINKADLYTPGVDFIENITQLCKKPPVVISANSNAGIDKLREEIVLSVPEDYDSVSITGNLVEENDLVLLVMPQDIQAPKGRLILPQVQTIRELLDKKCVVISCTTDKLSLTLKCLSKSPKIIITDSQVFKTVYEQKPKESLLTSFSVLFAQHKGDIEYFVKSVKVLENLKPDANILIAEACTHVPVEEDIGRVKIPHMLKARYGDDIKITNITGNDFPTDLSQYDLIIHCGACMFNRKYVLNRISDAKNSGIPMTNYGVVIAYLSGILDKINY
ncbi:MAG: [FeFe] hydrogenase H-cluster maturation GTPase HydF [Acutalibacteraceae bacterium]|nr:[FeFe] hydrogenase H-cluster maturation GTPase HydF [Acutalibacteraceae bacterium]